MLSDDVLLRIFGFYLDGEKLDTTEDDSIGDNSTEDNSTKDDSTKDNSTKDNSTKDNSTKDNSTKDNSTKDNSTKDNSTENNLTEVHSTEDNSTEDNSTEGNSTEDDAKSLDFSHLTEEKVSWQTLVHVCRRWRGIAFGSPRFLNLRLLCTDKTPVMVTLNAWPPLPIAISCDFTYSRGTPDLDNVVATLEHNDRICEISLDRPSSSQLEKVVAAMRQPFPALKILDLQLPDKTEPVVLPDSFLGGSAPGLQKLVLRGILFRALPKLLLSTAHLSTLSLLDTPDSGYISPDMMVTYISALTNLERLFLSPSSPPSPPNRSSQPSPLPTRSVLPALTRFGFAGFSEYLEDVVTRIDAPLLDRFSLSFKDEFAFETPQLVQLISRTPKLMAPEAAKVIFDFDDVQILLPFPTPIPKEDGNDEELELGISCCLSYQQMSSLAQAHSSSLFPFSTVKQLYFRETESQSIRWGSRIPRKEIRWLLRPFTAVETFYLSEYLADFVTPVLRKRGGERVTKMLPALDLQNIVYYWR
jgi:hypothetical protein